MRVEEADFRGTVRLSRKDGAGTGSHSRTAPRPGNWPHRAIAAPPTLARASRIGSARFIEIDVLVISRGITRRGRDLFQKKMAWRMLRKAWILESIRSKPRLFDVQQFSNSDLMPSLGFRPQSLRADP